PPIYQPEMIAEAVLWAAEHHPREMVIGGSALKAIVGQKFVPGLIDTFLAKTGYSSQQTDEPVDPSRPDNLCDPVPGDRGARGSFDSRARAWTPQLAARISPVATASTVSAVGLAAMAGLAASFARKG
ncbi:MAG: hypothetical protein WEC79_06460, partial [Thermomicrobiales bacterium]